MAGRLPPRPKMPSAWTWSSPARRSSAAAAPNARRGSSGSTWMRPRSPPSPPWRPRTTTRNQHALMEGRPW